MQAESVNRVLKFVAGPLPCAMNAAREVVLRVLDVVFFTRVLTGSFTLGLPAVRFIRYCLLCTSLLEPNLPSLSYFLV